MIGHCVPQLSSAVAGRGRESDFERDPQSRVQARPVCEHWVVRGDEDDVARLMAVRKDVAHM